MKNKKTLGFISLVFTLIVWGITFIATDNLLKDFTPIEIMFFRFGLSYIALFLVYPKIFKWQGWKIEGLCFLASLLGMSIYQTMENYAIKYADPNTVSIIIAIAPFFTALFAWLILKEKMKNIFFYIGCVISFIGIVFVILNGKALEIDLLGDFIAIAASVLWGLYSVIVDILAVRITEKNKEYKLIHTTRRITLYGFLVLIPMFFISGGKFELIRFTKFSNVAWMLYLGILASAVCFCTWNFSVSSLGTVPTSLGVLFQPIVTVVFGALVFNNKITWIGILGLTLTILGLYVSIFVKKKSKELV